MVICDCELVFLANAFMETKGKEERERKNEEHSIAWKSSVLRLRGRQKWFSGWSSEYSEQGRSALGTLLTAPWDTV